ncbi:uncharacterized protein LOC124321027 [Daphnia pulicaria]|nr:uncharacterized protein LOC124321027 [Daphnia pulicaria]XP_046639901.1 uncharacterized protein LOC124321027 [Daphnia pulicaria]
MAISLLKPVVACVLIITFSFESSTVSGGSLGSCEGLRVDRLEKGEFMTASKCISLFGTCCGTEPAIDKANEDPRKMKSSALCYTCYNSNISVKCTDDLLKTEDSLGAESCQRLGGVCCDATSNGGSAFNAEEYLYNHGSQTCNYCYSGIPQVSG